MPYYNRDPKRDHNFDNHPYDQEQPETAVHLQLSYSVAPGAWPTSTAKAQKGFGDVLGIYWDSAKNGNCDLGL